MNPILFLHSSTRLTPNLSSFEEIPSHVLGLVDQPSRAFGKDLLAPELHLFGVGRRLLRILAASSYLVQIGVNPRHLLSTLALAREKLLNGITSRIRVDYIRHYRSLVIVNMLISYLLRHGVRRCSFFFLEVRCLATCLFVVYWLLGAGSSRVCLRSRLIFWQLGGKNFEWLMFR